MVSLAFVLVSYQNCGGDVRTQGLFSEELSSSSVEEGCSSSACVRPEELLWIKIRESEPYRLNIQNISTHYTVGGVCGIGTFKSHSVIYEVKEAFGTQNVVGAGYFDDICDLGHFQIAISQNSYIVDQKYVLTLELVGLGEGKEPISNPMPSNISTIEVIFESGT